MKAPRLWDWWIATAAAAVLVAWIAPQQFQVVAYKAALVSLAVVLAYWADRSLFKSADRIAGVMVRDNLSAARVIARALIVLAVVLGITLGI